jgi:ribosomal protein S18 acetylase RimI-like enzyme
MKSSSNRATGDNLNYHVREAFVHDSSLLAELGAQTFREAFESFMAPFVLNAHITETYNQARQKEELNDPSKKFLILEHNRVAVGYALLHAHATPLAVRDARAIELSRLYLLKAYRGRGLGRALMQECLKLSLRRGHKSIWLAVWERNERAVSFYGKSGFEVVGTRPKENAESEGEDLIMSRLL